MGNDFAWRMRAIGCALVLGVVAQSPTSANAEETVVFDRDPWKVIRYTAGKSEDFGGCYALRHGQRNPVIISSRMNTAPCS